MGALSTRSGVLTERLNQLLPGGLKVATSDTHLGLYYPTQHGDLHQCGSIEAAVDGAQEVALQFLETLLRQLAKMGWVFMESPPLHVPDRRPGDPGYVDPGQVGALRGGRTAADLAALQRRVNEEAGLEWH